MDRIRSAGMRVVLAAALAVMVLGAALNLALDASGRWPRVHAGLEILTALLGMAIVTALWWGWRAAARAEAEARRFLEERGEERDAWRETARRALSGLGQAIDAQFRLWDLTPTEREIALLLLKGYSHKRIAEMTGRRERTVRQHGVVIYQKAGLSGRAELAAHFLEDLILPAPDAEPGAGTEADQYSASTASMLAMSRASIKKGL